MFTLKDLIKQYFFSVSAQFNLLNGADMDLKDSSRVNVEADIFDELLRSAKVSFKVSTELSGNFHGLFFKHLADVFIKCICQ